MRKRAFTPLTVEAFWIADTSALDAAVVAGQLRVSRIGRQAPKAPGLSGAARPDKFQMNVVRSRDGLRVSRREWHYR